MSVSNSEFFENEWQKAWDNGGQITVPIEPGGTRTDTATRQLIGKQMRRVLDWKIIDRNGASRSDRVVEYKEERMWRPPRRQP